MWLQKKGWLQEVLRSTELDERLDVKDEEEGRVLTACPRSA